MSEKSFAAAAMRAENPKWQACIGRELPMYRQEGDIRTEFDRDYTRILHSLGYRRLKHKTQVFYNTRNDHICTRMEHVNHVESVSETVAGYLGLNTALVRAIAMGHDIGHTPFGHEGEHVVSDITERYFGCRFHHEWNSLRFIDRIELLEDNNRCLRNLNLTYAVRDGIAMHCGETDENRLFPRQEAILLNTFTVPAAMQPYTWEGCVVKIADRIAYLGRDIEDALRLHFIGEPELAEFRQIAVRCGMEINTTTLMNRLITDLCTGSDPEEGLHFSPQCGALIDEIKRFNYRTIYDNPKFNYYHKYVRLVIESIFEEIMQWYRGADTLRAILREPGRYPRYAREFCEWIAVYCESAVTSGLPEGFDARKQSKNFRIYGELENKKLYVQAAVDYITGMTDAYAISVFEELTSF